MLLLVIVEGRVPCVINTVMSNDISEHLSEFPICHPNNWFLGKSEKISLQQFLIHPPNI